MSSRRRQELYDRIRESSRDEVIREEMVRLGFWKTDSGPAQMTDEWLQRRNALTKEINQLAAKQRRFENREEMLKVMRKRRMAESREKQKETRERRERERQEKAAAWAQKKEHDLVYLGESVSTGLNGKQEIDSEKLAGFGLPDVPSIDALATALGTTISELRFLAFHREISKTTHYRRFFMPKKSGGQRLISAPMPRLKAAQYAVLWHFLEKVPVHEAAHGFAPGRSIVTNAQRHTGKSVVINMDVKDFFPSVSYKRVKGLFRSLGYAEKVATVLGLICTEPDTEEVELDGERWHVHTSERKLPQGAPTSPAITNVLCYRLDRRLSGMASKLGFAYTRYADDMTFSASGDAAENFKKLLWRAHSIVKDEGFQVHPDKTRIMRRGRRQEVTGLTVNDSVSVPRRDLRNFRALLYQIEKDGPGGKKWRGSDRHLLAAIRGYACFIRMVDDEKGAPFVEQVNRILARENWTHEIRHWPKPKEPASSPESGPKKKSFLERLKFWK